MPKDERDLLEVLECELQFLEEGGYSHSPKTPWRPRFIFEDSPTCMNYDSKEKHGPCSDCVLMHLVPARFCSAKIPCRHIALNAAGETLDSLYRYGDPGETEQTVGTWLRSIIQCLRELRTPIPTVTNPQPAASGGTLKGTPLYQKQHPKCANPACSTAFHWTGGGKFFRFRPDPVAANENNPTPDPPAGIHGVRHYWLCEPCSHVFTLAQEEANGVVLQALWPKLATEETTETLSASS
jgi:hypothetical protein